MWWISGAATKRMMRVQLVKGIRKLRRTKYHRRPNPKNYSLSRPLNQLYCPSPTIKPFSSGVSGKPALLILVPLSNPLFLLKVHRPIFASLTLSLYFLFSCCWIIHKLLFGLSDLDNKFFRQFRACPCAPKVSSF